MLTKTKLWQHQQEMVDHAISCFDSYGYVWWLAGCAVGKTLAAYEVARRIDAKSVLVLTTKAAITSAWLQDAAKHLDSVSVVGPTKGTVKQRVSALYDRYDHNPLVFVINYEAALRAMDELMDFQWDLVIADESHKLKSYSSQTSNALAELARNVPYKIAMTGTPWDDRPTDAFGQARFLDSTPGYGSGYMKSRLLGAYTPFYEQYVIYKTKDNIKIPTGYKNIDELRSIVAPFTLYVDSEDVLELPEEMIINRYVDLAPKTMKIYQELQDEYITWVDGEPVIVDNPLTLSMRLHQVCSGYVGSDSRTIPGESAKLDETMSIIDEVGGKPVVVFTTFTEDVRRIAAACKKEKIGTRLLVGGTHEHVEWQAGAGQVLIANLAAGSEGVDLTRARYVVYHSYSHSKTAMTQSRARVRRPGSDLRHPITYYMVQARKTVDVAILGALRRKGKTRDLMYEGLTRLARS